MFFPGKHIYLLVQETPVIHELEQAIEKISKGELPLRQTEGAFGVPKST